MRAERAFAARTSKAYGEMMKQPAPWAEMLKARGGRRKS